ncbi:uncharacterized protein LOC132718561 [Ruditapes philippinarum]|uniref:uncharacterized protein LOC132718561 n=1 Tax=Ruditapes philippinarum TaxID=129788 RepID=UPI00295A5CC6|nr:uncharacterized protein LOC132718561 [Ruditapes philippinarum]
MRHKVNHCHTVKMADRFLITLILFVGITGVVAGSYCSSSSDSSYGWLSHKYCENGCCGDSDNRYCCTEYTVNVGMIVGIVLGSGFLIATIVTVIVVVMCCCRKPRAQPGQVVQPMVATVQAYNVPGRMGTGSPVTIMTTNARPGPGQQQWQQRNQPPARSENASKF